MTTDNQPNSGDTDGQADKPKTAEEIFNEEVAILSGKTKGPDSSNGEGGSEADSSNGEGGSEADSNSGEGGSETDSSKGESRSEADSNTQHQPTKETEKESGTQQEKSEIDKAVAAQIEQSNKQVAQLTQQMGQMANLIQELQSNKASSKPSENTQEANEPLDISKLNLSEDERDILDSTPGLDKIIAEITSKQSQVLIEKALNQYKEEMNQSQLKVESEQKEAQFWTDIENQFKGKYPELSVPQIRNSPEFKDWMEVNKNWVDHELSSKDRYDISGVESVLDRYVMDKGLKPKENNSKQKNNSDRLASARSPRSGGSSDNPTSKPLSPAEVFKQESERLSQGTSHRRVI